MSGEMELVIAAYNRNYSWVRKLPEGVKLTVYRKGNRGHLKDGEIYIAQNVGRDVHTFFHHIVERYDSLSEYTFFVQDFPFDHVFNVLELLSGNEKLWDQEALMNVNGCWFFDTNYERILVCDSYGRPDHPGVMMDIGWMKVFPDTPVPDKFEFVAAGHFIVSRDNILSKPKQYYERIKSLLERYPEMPWIIERLEPEIFRTNEQSNEIRF